MQSVNSTRNRPPFCASLHRFSPFDPHFAPICTPFPTLHLLPPSAHLLAAARVTPLATTRAELKCAHLRSAMCSALMFPSHIPFAHGRIVMGARTRSALVNFQLMPNAKQEHRPICRLRFAADLCANARENDGVSYYKKQGLTSQAHACSRPP